MKTVKVRIPVAVYPDGAVITRLWSNFEDEETTVSMLRMIYGDTAKVEIVTAEVPVPEPTEVEERVETDSQTRS